MNADARKVNLPLPAVLSVCCGVELKRGGGGWICPRCKRVVSQDRPEPGE